MHQAIDVPDILFKDCEMPPLCRCSMPADYAVEERGSYRPVCARCRYHLRLDGESKIVETLPRLGRNALDRGHASGLCVCATCGKKYFDHPQAKPEYSFLNELCDGSLVKL